MNVFIITVIKPIGAQGEKLNILISNDLSHKSNSNN